MSLLDPHDPEVWRLVRSTAGRGLRSSLHAAIATTMPDGSPHVTPVGSVALSGPGAGLYLDLFNVQLDRNLNRDPRLTIMLVDSGKRTWGRALLSGRFDAPPGVRLIGEAGPARAARPEELERFRRAVRAVVRTKGGAAMWGHTSGIRVRDLTFTGVAPVHIGRVTKGLWPRPVRPEATV